MKKGIKIPLLFIVLSIIALLLYIHFSRPKIQEILIPELMSGKELIVSYSEESGLGEFASTDRLDNVIQFTNNIEESASQQMFKYFYNEEELLNEYGYGTGVSSQYEKDILDDGSSVYYIRKFEDSGVILRWDPKVPVGDYKGSLISNYHNFSLPDGETRGYAYTSGSTLTSSYCVIDLNQVDENEFGYLVFDGITGTDTEVNYCSILNELDLFELDIK